MFDLYNISIAVTIFCLGACWGSFYNVVVYRLPRNLPIVNDHSMCPSCGKRLQILDLVPLFSWLFLKRKCRYCAGPISWRYPLIELLTAILALGAFFAFGLTLQTLFCVAFLSILIIIALIDFDEKLIFNCCLIPLGICAAAWAFLSDKGVYEHLWGLLLGTCVWGAVYWLARLFYKREALGSGDVWLMAAIGLMLGFSGAIITSLLAIYLAAFAIIVARIFGKKLVAKQEIPLGTFMCIGAGITVFFQQSILNFYFSWF